MYLEMLKQEERLGLRIWWLNNRRKSMTNVLDSYKLTKKLWVNFLDIKLQ